MIRILDNNLINKIAAGEVVERPASVVKELVENSLDAGADFITIEIKNGGIDLIEVADNGKGMNREDAQLSVERHATSKIEKLEDLNNIMSFGFRGEALSAISAVSKFSLQTKEKGAVSGIVVQSGRRGPLTTQGDSSGRVKPARLNSRLGGGPDLPDFETQDIGCSEGTKIRVEDIFYNVPARRKFLKTVQTEFSHILNTLMDIALANPKVRFKFAHNGRVIFDYHASADGLTRMSYGFSPQSSQLSNGIMSDGARRSADWAERVKNVLGSDNFSNMISFYREAGEIVLSGFVSFPANARLIKGQQYLFVNNRPVNNNIVHKAIYNGYKNFIPGGSHPSFVIKLDLEPEVVDVNVHPRKMEVRFLHQQEVFKTVEAVVREAVGNSEKFRNLETCPELVERIKKLEISAKGGSAFGGRNWKLEIGENFKKQNKDFKFQNEELAKAKSFSSPIKGLTPPLPHSKGELLFHSRIKGEAIKSFNDSMFSGEKLAKEEKSWKLIGQVKDLYLVVEAEDSFILIDQHAAHERIIYDKIIEKMENDTYKAQTLLAPLNIELTLGELETVKNNFEFLKKLGFELEEFGVNTIIVQAVPQDIAGKDIGNIIKGIIGDFIIAGKDDLDGGEEALKRIRNKIVCYIACRSAVKQGDKLSLDEQMDLVKKVISGEVKDTCPHGRPIKAKLRWDEIGKKFKRNS
ncbi:hypothetical protein A2Y83_05180 [Candidatus Falkowbacteria bacterium RBG_13_39_14]|uniref:DNA mismatch repair protein MutL n=1 Tax=Candidatus Falkowbacteria bacterium RBG_13_39_14 TaxID=1797985 RepID=A0A1F5S5G7_9BACT|nr:MAG: hypothetical protein A2Y83_05180 [Candidatus Falkowbacteria bacterium RBG_13_39_14]